MKDMFQKENPGMMGFLGLNLAESTRFIFEILSWLARLLVYQSAFALFSILFHQPNRECLHTKPLSRLIFRDLKPQVGKLDPYGSHSQPYFIHEALNVGTLPRSCSGFAWLQKHRDLYQDVNSL